MSRPEFELIDWIRHRAGSADWVKLGIGDDAANLQFSDPSNVLVAVDMLMDGTHFRLNDIDPRLAGRKALAVNLSDLAAMGGKPLAAFVAVALPQAGGPEVAQQIHQGILDLAEEHGVIIAGGDTNTWRGPLVISITVLGQPIGAQPISRNGGQVGDWLMVTGSLGGSLQGRHLTFEPRLVEARQLVEMVDLHAMMDISDGLAADLHHILNASGVGADLEAGHIPISSTVPLENSSGSRLMSALSDGEDFELLFSLSPDHGRKLLASWPLPTPLTKIGELTAVPGCRLHYPDGNVQPLSPLGWTHTFS